MFWKNKKNETIEKETELTNIEQSLKELWKQHEDMTIAMRSERNLREKRKIEEKRTPFYLKIQDLEKEKEEIEDKQALAKTDSLIRENSSIIVIEVNKIRIPANEKITVKFYPCGHKQEFVLREILRRYNYLGNVFQPERNVSLLDRWQRIIKDNDFFATEFHCQKCQKQIQELKAKHRSIPANARIGNAIIMIRKLQ